MKIKQIAALYLALAFCSICTATTSDTNLPLDIQVRSEVDRPFKGWGREEKKDHGKVYLIAAISEARSEQQLVLPLKEEILLQHLRQELSKRGFREYSKEEPPEIILTILYGRGYLENPYLSDAMYNEMFNPPISTILAGNAKQLMRQKEFDFENKLQAANFEKLFIRVTAWANPSDLPEAKPGKNKKNKILWKTTMVTDDPKHRDLNQFVDKLLAAGSNFFDQEIEKNEAFVRTDLPEGYVNIGDAKVMPDHQER